MKPLAWVALAAITVSACAPARTAPATAPTPAPAPTTAAAPAPATAVPATTGLREAPRDWQRLDESKDHVPGISSERALRELLAGRQPARTVVVAVIDGGV